MLKTQKLDASVFSVVVGFWFFFFLVPKELSYTDLHVTG